MPTLNEVMSLTVDAVAPASPKLLEASPRLPTLVAGPAPPLANRKAPYYTTKQERPAHRMMLELAAQGYDVKEISEMTGYTQVCVNNILRQPHAQQTLVDEIRRCATVDDEVVQVIKENVVKSVKFYEQVLNDPTKDTETRLKAAEAFLNRRYGKPNVPFSQGTIVDLNKLPDEELARMVVETSGSGTSGAA